MSLVLDNVDTILCYVLICLFLDQMLAHLCLKFRTDSEGLQQQESLDSLPKAIRSSISHFPFYSLLDKAYLFHGVSNDLLFQLVCFISYLLSIFFGFNILFFNL